MPGSCPYCGEPHHLTLCAPALSQLLADQHIDHEADLRKLTLLRIENAELRRRLAERKHP